MFASSVLTDTHTTVFAVFEKHNTNPQPYSLQETWPKKRDHTYIDTNMYTDGTTHATSPKIYKKPQY